MKTIKYISISQHWVDYKGSDSLEATGMEFDCSGTLFEIGRSNEHIALVTPMKTTMPVVWIGHTVGEMAAWLKSRYPSAAVDILESAIPIDNRMSAKIDAFIQENGYPPSRLEIGEQEWFQMKYWVEEMGAKGLLVRKTGEPVPPHPMFRGVELHKHVRLGIVARP